MWGTNQYLANGFLILNLKISGLLTGEITKSFSIVLGVLCCRIQKPLWPDGVRFAQTGQQALCFLYCPNHHLAVEFGTFTSLQLTSFWSLPKKKKLFHLHNLQHGASRSMILFVCSTKQEGTTLSTDRVQVVRLFGSDLPPNLPGSPASQTRIQWFFWNWET